MDVGEAAHPEHGPETVGARITAAGRQYLARYQEQKFTRLIAVIGVLTGIAALVISLCALWRS